MSKLTPAQLAKLQELSKKLQPLGGVRGGPLNGSVPGGGFYYIR